MFGNIEAERKAIEMTYEDLADIRRASKKKGEDGISRSEFETIYSGVRCALSYLGSDGSRQTNAQGTIDYTTRVFAGPDIIVEPGDKIILSRFGYLSLESDRKQTFDVVGRPNIYATHQEIKVKDSDLA